ncbi:aminoglycoside adenylyltransferase, partial [Providencia rettgeri]|nr:aminoglycoside adenylyltransferase [Providencia rettgeri]
LWVAWSRSADMKQYFLTLVENLVSLQGKHVWYKGRQYHEWMPKPISRHWRSFLIVEQLTALHCLFSV